MEIIIKHRLPFAFSGREPMFYCEIRLAACEIASGEIRLMAGDIR